MTLSRKEAEEAIALIENAPDPGLVSYISGHRERLIKTVQIIPAGQGAVLDVGAAGFMLHLLRSSLGYSRAVGVLHKVAGSPALGTLEYLGSAHEVVYLDAERDSYPFPDATFDVVTCFEVIEHFTCDPMSFLLEAWRVLKPGGTLIISTPNSGSFEALLNWQRGIPPMLFFKYVKGQSDRHHIEYTPKLLADTIQAAAFEVTALETHDDKPEIRKVNSEFFARAEHFAGSAELRDRRIYLTARKSHGPVARYPSFLYL